jgi:hypothetical protein
VRYVGLRRDRRNLGFRRVLTAGTGARNRFHTAVYAAALLPPPGSVSTAAWLHESVLLFTRTIYVPRLELNSYEVIRDVDH